MKKILIVDDNQNNLDLLKAILGSKFVIIGAKDGEIALNLAKEQSPDLIITDYQMPNMDGKTFVQEVRKDLKFQNIPIIFSTSADFVPDTSLMAIACGVPFVMPKPCDPTLILKAVETAFSLQEKSVEKDLVIIASDVNLVKKAITELLERSDLIKEKAELNIILKVINQNIQENKEKL